MASGYCNIKLAYGIGSENPFSIRNIGIHGDRGLKDRCISIDSQFILDQSGFHILIQVAVSIYYEYITPIM